MPTWRHFSRKVFECGIYEGQDVLVACDDVDVLAPEPTRHFRTRERWHDRFLFRDFSHRLALMNPGLRPHPVTRDYELMVVFCATYEDLLYVNALRGWKDHCRTSVCWLDEIWPVSLSKYRHWLPALAQFDHVMVATHSTAALLSRIIGRPCTSLPSGVDALRFTPLPHPQPRGIDIYSIGRRRPALHDALLSVARARDLLYLYDTFKASVADAYSVVEHRDQTARIAKRSRYFMVAPPKMDQPDETGGAIEVGWRYFEGAAAGCVLLGQAADSESFRELFGWPDVVIEVAPDGSDVAQVLAELDACPERLAAISQRNAVEALRRHDWVYRWHTILDAAGLAPTDRMVARERQLHALAAAADTGAAPTRAVLG
jgi:hypothetical protein